MALAATGVVELRTTGSNANSGGFNSAASGTDYSQQNASQKSGSDLAIHASDNTKVQPVAAGVAAADIGNYVYISAGSGFTAGYYEITAQDGTYWTLDRAAGTTSSTGGTYTMGGAVLDPGIACSIQILTAGIDVWAKSGTYAVTSTTANIAAGRVNITTGGASATNTTKYRAYSSTRGDDGARVVIQASGAFASSTLFTIGATFVTVRGFEFDGASKSTVRGFSSGVNHSPRVEYCWAKNCTNSGFNSSTGPTTYYRCVATGCSSSGHGFNCNVAQFFYCEAYDNTVGGFIVSGAGSLFSWCLAYRNRGASVHGFETTQSGTTWSGCVAFYNQGDGFKVASATTLQNFFGCIAYNNGGYGFDFAGASESSRLISCAAGSNTSGATVNLTTSGTESNVENLVTLTADPFTSASTSTAGASDFSLNNTAGGGAACRAAAGPSSWPASTAVGYSDIGAVQSAAGGGGGGPLIGPGRLVRA